MQFEFALAFTLFIFIYCPFVVFFGCLQHCKLCKLLSSYSLDSNPNNNKKTHTHSKNNNYKDNNNSNCERESPLDYVSQLVSWLVSWLVSVVLLGSNWVMFSGNCKGDTQRERDSKRVRGRERTRATAGCDLMKQKSQS